MFVSKLIKLKKYVFCAQKGWGWGRCKTKEQVLHHISHNHPIFKSLWDLVLINTVFKYLPMIVKHLAWSALNFFEVKRLLMLLSTILFRKCLQDWVFMNTVFINTCFII